jgi:hypothetical protein
LTLGFLLVALTIALWPEPDTATEAPSATKKATSAKPEAARDDDKARSEPTTPAAASADWASEPGTRVLEAPPSEANEASPVEVTPEAGPRVEARGSKREQNQAARRSGHVQDHALRAPVPKPQTVDCREPYAIDALGVKHWKRECL